MSAPHSSSEPMPPGIGNIYVYEVFNAASWVVVLGTPMLLFLQKLNASATILAIAASIAPVMSILQIPAAPYAERIGYRRMVISGWTTRSLFILGMAVVAFLPDAVDRTTRIVAMLFLSLAYNFIRGISICGLLPWFTHIVPESRRGEFLAKDQLAAALAIIVALLAFSGILGHGDRWYSFGLVFALSAGSAFVSLRFLRRVPDVAQEKAVPNTNPLPWKEMFFHRPFQRYIRYNVVVNLALGASGVFWVRMFRDSLHISDSSMLMYAALSMATLALALFLASSIIDRTGNRPALTLSGGLFICHFVLWAGAAAGVIPCTVTLIVFQGVISGFASALWNLANLRAVLGIVPVMGRAHFLALYSVAANLTLALIPLLWGPIIDGLAHWQAAWGWWHWNSFSVLYLTQALTVLCALAMLRTVAEPEAMSWDRFTRELFVNTPGRAISRLITRFKGPSLS